MKRTIRVRADEVTITAMIDSRHLAVTRDEVEKIRDELADRLQAACSDLPYGAGCPRNRVRVS